MICMDTSSTNTLGRGRRLAVTATLASLLGFIAVGLTTVNAPPAKAMVCGYYEELRQHDSLISINTPLGSLDPFGGLRQVAMYGHCGETNIRITVVTDNGNVSTCVTPGESTLGMVTSGRKVSYAYYTGLC